MHRFLVFLALLPLCLISGCSPNPRQAVREMVEAERKFYQTGQEQGTRAAFLNFLSDNGIVFRPGPVNGEKVWQEKPENGLDLIWEPVWAGIARSGDFGYTTGPAKWKTNKNEAKPVGFGEFISVWKKERDGSWKVAVDCGIEHPEPAGKTEELQFSLPPDPAPEAADPTAECAACNSLEVVMIEDGTVVCRKCGVVLVLEMTEVAPG